MKELQIIRESIQEVTGVDIMMNSRRRKVVDAKALFYYFAKEFIGKEEVLISKFTKQDRTTVIYYWNQSHHENFGFTYEKEINVVESLIIDKMRLDKPIKATFTFDGVSRDLFFSSKKELQYKVGDIYSKTLNIVS